MNCKFVDGLVIILLNACVLETTQPIHSTQDTRESRNPFVIAIGRVPASIAVAIVFSFSVALI
jgi:hypothetical protein